MALVGTFIVDKSDADADMAAQIGTFSQMQMTEGICAADSQNRIVHWSAGMERMFGVDEKDAVGQLLGNLLTFIGKDQQFIDEARAGRVGRNVHEHYVRPRNMISRFQITYGILKSGEDEAGLMCFVREVGASFDKTPAPQQETDGGGSQASTKADLDILESRLRLVADAIPNLVWLSDVTGDRVLFNEKWQLFTGRNFEQERGRGWWNGMHADDARKFARIYAEALNERKGYHTQYRLRRADGQYRLLLESGVPQFTEEGIFLGMMGSCNDISETHFTQQGMQPAQRVSASFSSTLDHAPIAIWRLDRDLVIKKANKAVAIQLRMPEANLIGKRFGALVHSIPESTFDAVLDRGERIQLENFAVLLDDSKDAKPVFWDVVAWPQKDNEGHVTGVCISSAEVTERQRQNQQKDDFVAALVHDLKTPLIGADRTLEQMIGGGLGNLDSGQTDVLSMLRRSNHQLLVMVQNLIEVYRYEAGHPSLAFEELDIFDLLKKCVPELQALADHRGIDLAAQLPSSRPNIVGDRLAIRRVFLNLLDNALKFTGRDGTVRVTADVKETFVLVKVADTGLGITQDDQSKLFQRYYQGETGKRYAIGTGLGLYLCKQIVTAHKGTITVESEEGKGTTFSITLPLAT
jgi:PAS domain S-box-containing protein